MTQPGKTQHQDQPAASSVAAGADSTTRRAFLNAAGRKACYVAPLIVTLTAAQARADADYNASCYGFNHPCPGAEPCCPPLTCKLTDHKCR